MTRPIARRASKRRERAFTIREIAEEAGVSIATVSRVFNNPELVREPTRARVLAVIKRHHYVSDGLAVGLASRKSRLLGIIIPTLANSIYASSTQAAQQAAQAAGYTVLVGVSDFSKDREASLVHQLIERRIEGLVLTGADRAPDLYAKLAHNRVPIIVTWKLRAGAERPSVSFDNYKAASAAVEHLLALGHRRIGLTCGRTDLNDRARDRRLAFEHCLAEHGLRADPDLIFEGNFEFGQGRLAMKRMLRHAHPPTAMFCANDIQAIGALYECRAAGLVVPRDMSIVGFDNLPICQYTTPRLTTVHVPAAEMGRRAIEALLRRQEAGEEAGEGAPAPRLELPSKLVMRETTAPPERPAAATA